MVAHRDNMQGKWDAESVIRKKVWKSAGGTATQSERVERTATDDQRDRRRKCGVGVRTEPADSAYPGSGGCRLEATDLSGRRSRKVSLPDCNAARRRRSWSLIRVRDGFSGRAWFTGELE